MSRPDVIPLFPLPNAVHFPGVPLPLHIFEARYRAMVRDALAGHRLIGMVLLRRGWEDEYQGRPPVFATGTAGEIVRSEELEDGRYNIVLKGVSEFVIVREQGDGPYREALVEWRPTAMEPVGPQVGRRVWRVVRGYLTATGRRHGMATEPAEDSDPATIINFFAQQLDLDPIVRQGLLEAPALAVRAEQLVAALDFQLELLRSGGGQGSSTLQ